MDSQIDGTPARMLTLRDLPKYNHSVNKAKAGELQDE